jgi:origin recognition complex subunit 2
MKRKKEAEDQSNETGPLQKRTRSGIRAESPAEGDGKLDSIHAIPVRRKSRRKATSDVDPDHATSQETNEDEDGIEADKQDATSEGVDEDEDGEIGNHTPMKRGKRGFSGSANKAQSNGTSPIKGKPLFSTPMKANGASETTGTPRLERHADRSARRKSTRNIIERTVLGNTSDIDEDDEDLAQHIYGSEDEEDFEPELPEMGGNLAAGVPATPSERGRKKGSQNRKRSPTPQNLPPHELYFSQNRGGRTKTSINNLSSLALLDHEEYFKLARAYEDPHTDDLEFLQQIHTSSFNQWHFELSQDFNICLHGWGSKRSLLMKFATHLYKAQGDQENNKIVVVNGYVHNLAIRDVLNTVAAAISDKVTKLGLQPAEMLDNLTAMLEEDKSKLVTLIIHSIDGTPLRRPTTQTILSRLGTHPQIHVVASADHPSFPLLWDSSLRSTFNFLFHDCTTYQTYSSELDVVDDVHELLGRSGRRVGGKEGVSFVLKSLPENAKNLFRVLIGEQLAAMDENAEVGFGGAYDDDNNEQRTGSKRTEGGVEYRVLYQKAVEEFICSNEMNFRTLLKE